MIASILASITWSAVGGLAGKLWKGFCDFISTPIGAALIAGLLMYNVGKIHEARIVNAEWQAKWTAAEAEAEQARLKRDVLVKATVEADANKRLAELAERKEQLERMVQAYADDEAKQTAVGNSCLTNSSDERWLRDAQRGYAKPSARRGLAIRLRTLSQ